MRSKRFGFLLSVAVIFAVVIGGVFISSLSQAATIIVTPSAPDELSNNGSCSLREAITNINNGATTWADCVPNIDPYGTYDTIYLRAGNYVTTIGGNWEDLNASGDYDIRRSVVIAGDGAGVTTINGGGVDRVFQIIPGGYTVWISGVTITGGNAGGTINGGGGIENDGGALTVANSIITGNTAPNGGGGIENNGGNLTVNNSTISGNTTTGWGGGILNDSGNLTVTNSTISGNTGGGIFNASTGTAAVTNCIITGNTTFAGGGGIESTSGNLTVNNSTISGNTTSYSGGGGIENNGRGVIVNSTISGNATGYKGGGIENHVGTLIVTNCTITGNSALAGGGGIVSGGQLVNGVVYNADATILDSTISGNSGGSGVGGILNDSYSTTTVKESIVTNQTVGADCSGTTTYGWNLESGNTCGFAGTGDKQNTNPMLGALADNGGPTQTMALLAGSPAIDAGGCFTAYDQRGIARPQGAGCDIGAFEFVSPTTCTFTLSPTSQTFSSSGGTGSVTVTASGSSCAWTSSSSLSWVRITSGCIGGCTPTTFTVSANTLGAGQRTGNITIAGKTFMVTQADTIFADVSSTNVFYSYINAIYNASITVGCSQNPLMYCPDASVTRGQMAAFIIRAKYGENFTYTQTPYFSDVPATNGFFKYVQKMKDTGITAVTGTYDVNGTVTRGQMAAFIIRAKYGENFTYTSTPWFSDVPATNNFFKYVQKLKDTGITSVAGTYDVNGTVTRGQMAAFIARAFLGMP